MGGGETGSQLGFPEDRWELEFLFGLYCLYRALILGSELLNTKFGITLLTDVVKDVPVVLLLLPVPSLELHGSALFPIG